MCRYCNNTGWEMDRNSEYELCSCGVSVPELVKLDYSTVMTARQVLSRNFMTMAISRVIYPFKQNMEACNA